MHNWTIGALAVALALVQPAAAQERAGIAIRGGGFNGLTDLDDAGSADFNKVGYNLGATVDVDLHRYVGLRGDFTFARNELRQNEIDTGSDLNRFFYDAALQLQYPSTTGWKPYAFVGAGAVTLDPEGAGDSSTKAAGTVGLGLSYQIPRTDLGVVVEGKGWLYDLSDMDGTLATFDRTQFEVTWSAGFSYRVPIGSTSMGR